MTGTVNPTTMLVGSSQNGHFRPDVPSDQEGWKPSCTKLLKTTKTMVLPLKTMVFLTNPYSQPIKVKRFSGHLLSGPVK